MAGLVRQSLSGQAPLFLADNCCLVSDSTRRSLRSADVPTCVVPQTLITYCNSTFTVTGPCLWNSSGPAAQSRHYLRTVQATAEGTPLSGTMNTALCNFWYAFTTEKHLTCWLGGRVIRTADSQLTVEGSPPGHDTAWLFISETDDRLWRVNCLENCNHHLAQLSLASLRGR